MTIKVHYAWSLVLLFLVSACDIINPEEDIPAYIYIEKFDLTTNYSSQGTDSEDITEVWIYHGIDLLGAFKLPATIPVLASGTQSIMAFPGIHDNGISALPDIYPFYTSYDLELDLLPGRVDTIYPQTTYKSNIDFVLFPQEGFEGNSNLIGEELDGNSQTRIVNSNLDVFEGSASGRIHLDQTNNTIEVGSARFTDFPSATSSVYMELNYKSDVEFAVGLIGYDDLGNVAYSSFEKGLNPREDWTKIYFNFTEQIQLIGVSTSPVRTYHFCIHSRLRSDQTEADIYLDNIKWLQF